MNQLSAPIVSNSEIMPDVYLMWVEAAEIASTVQPGQFLMVQCGESLLRRPLSVHRIREGGQLALLYATIGRGTNSLSRLKKGSTVDLLGPLGNGFSVNSKSRRVLLIAGGIGIAPLVFLTDAVLKQGLSVTMLLGAATAAQVYPVRLLPPQIQLTLFTEDGLRVGRKGIITDAVPEFVHQADQVFACGPIGMYRRLVSLMEEIENEKPIQVSLEVRMGCGIGACYGCSIRTKSGMKQVCKDGPVFELSEINLEEVRI